MEEDRIKVIAARLERQFRAEKAGTFVDTDTQVRVRCMRKQKKQKKRLSLSLSLALSVSVCLSLCCLSLSFALSLCLSLSLPFFPLRLFLLHSRLASFGFARVRLFASLSSPAAMARS